MKNVIKNTLTKELLEEEEINNNIELLNVIVDSDDKENGFKRLIERIIDNTLDLIPTYHIGQYVYCVDDIHDEVFHGKIIGMDRDINESITYTIFLNYTVSFNRSDVNVNEDLIFGTENDALAYLIGTKRNYEDGE